MTSSLPLPEPRLVPPSKALRSSLFETVATSVRMLLERLQLREKFTVLVTGREGPFLMATFTLGPAPDDIHETICQVTFSYFNL